MVSSKFLSGLDKNDLHHFDSHLDKDDERFTSQLAMRAMIDGGMKRSERRIKGSVDRISAAIILQSWLDGQNNAAKPICGNADDLAQQ